MAGEFIRYRLTVPRDRVHLLRFLLEGYDGLFRLTTLDRERGVVLLEFPAPCEQELKALLDGIRPRVRILRIQRLGPSP